MKKIFCLTILAVLCTFGVASAQQFPSVQIETQDGKTIIHTTRKSITTTYNISNLSTLIDGKTPVIISFWSTTCKPCIKELAAISEQMIDWLDEADFRVVAVSVDDSRSISRAKALAASRGWTTDLMVAYDKNQDFKRALNVNVTPHVFIFDKDGKMVYSHTSYLPGGEMELIQKIKTLQ